MLSMFLLYFYPNKLNKSINQWFFKLFHCFQSYQCFFVYSQLISLPCRFFPKSSGAATCVIPSRPLPASSPVALIGLRNCSCYSRGTTRTSRRCGATPLWRWQSVDPSGSCLCLMASGQVRLFKVQARP